jgi:hypothetical protein
VSLANGADQVKLAEQLSSTDEPAASGADLDQRNFPNTVD